MNLFTNHPAKVEGENSPGPEILEGRECYATQRHVKKLAPGARRLGGSVWGHRNQPLYALRECLGEGRFLSTDPVTVLGPVSLMLWSFILIVSVKYLLMLTRATNQGEGGVFALLSILKQPVAGLSSKAISCWGSLPSSGRRSCTGTA